MQEPVWVETAVVAAMLGNAEVAAIAENRIYPLIIPQGTVLPCVTYQRYSASPHMTLGGYGSESVVVLVVAYARTFAEAKALAKAVRAAMAADPVRGVIRSDRDIYYEGGGAYSVHMEFICNQTGGYCYGY